jgi:hypothetical protein
MKMIKKIICNIPGFIVSLFLVWCLLSYIDIVSDNTTDHPVHSDYNIINVLEEVTNN